jgi:hypothetical protein
LFAHPPFIPPVKGGKLLKTIIVFGQGFSLIDIWHKFSFCISLNEENKTGLKIPGMTHEFGF